MSKPFAPWSLKPKDDALIPHRVAFELIRDGWYLRSEIIWEIPNVSPESITDRPTRSHQLVFMITKSPSYFYDADAVREPVAASSVRRVQLARSRIDPSTSDGGYKSAKGRMVGTGDHADHLLGVPHPLGRNRRSVWTIPAQPSSDAHPAPWPAALVSNCIMAGSPMGGSVLDPFCGSGTTLVVARELGRKAIGIELNRAYCSMIRRRLESNVEDEVSSATARKTSISRPL
jgi:site-specific DNA-methyltransferase (adenine-specific)